MGQIIDCDPTTQRSARRIALLTLIIVSCYVVVRHLIYHAMPAQDFESWFTRDLVMSAPRLLGFLVCVFLASRHGGLRRWGWTFSLTVAGITALILPTTMELLHRYALASESVFSSSKILLGWISTGPVALFEEAAFRSLLFLSFKQRMPPKSAAIASSAFFMVYHIEAQPMNHWPHIFVFGLGACAAIHRGTGLGWLIAAHWIVDGAWFHLSTGPGVSWAWGGHILFLLVTSVVSMALLKAVGSGEMPNPSLQPPADKTSEEDCRGG